MDDFYYEEDNGKVALKVFIIIFIIGVICGLFFYFKKHNTIKLRKVTIEVGSTISNNIDDYILSGKKIAANYTIDLSKVDSNKVGKYTYKVKYNKHTINGTINVVDKTAPTYLVDNDIVVGRSYSFEPSLFILNCSDYSLPCNVSFKNDSDIDKLKNVGEYTVPIVISDKYNNKKIENVTIKVVEGNSISSKSTDDLEYYTNSDNDDTLKRTMFLKLEKGIVDGSGEYEDIFAELSLTDFSLYETDISDTKMITVYNKYGYVIGFQVEITKQDGTKKLLEK